MAEQNQTMTVEVPVDMKFTMKTPEGGEVIVTVPKGSKFHGDESTNILFYGGYMPDDAKVFEFEDDNKAVSLRIANKRPHQNATGGMQIFPNGRFLKIRGQNVEIAEDLKAGTRLLVSGYMNTDKVAPKEEGGKARFLDNLYIHGITVLSKPRDGEKLPQRKGAVKEKGKTTLAAATSQIKAPPKLAAEAATSA